MPQLPDEPIGKRALSGYLTGQILVQGIGVTRM